MAKINMPPTKTNLRNVKLTHSIAKEGYELLEQKREILVMELMSYLEKVKRVEKDLYKLLFDGYASFKKTVYSFGHREVEDKVKFINYDFNMVKKTTKLMGINLSTVKITPPQLKLQCSFLTSNASIDETSNKFLKIIKLMSELAEIRSIVWKLSNEVKKTQRRVNALDKIVIPETKDTIKFIESSLEEKERDELFISKLVKTKLEAYDETNS
ncbi:MAG TPA: V-type ATP synthase subunit D [Spirochaetota bacterium]|nr:V-type ATP synthase subunit D [Spirochaetota bacterium]